MITSVPDVLKECCCCVQGLLVCTSLEWPVGRQVSTSKQVHANGDKWEWEQSEEAEEWDVRVEEKASCESWDVSFWPREENMTRKFDILSFYPIQSCDWKCKMVGLCVGGCLDAGICTERFHNCSNREAFLNHTRYIIAAYNVLFAVSLPPLRRSVSDICCRVYRVYT